MDVNVVKKNIKYICLAQYSVRVYSVDDFKGLCDQTTPALNDIAFIFISI